jgi:hypothetical protein
MDALLHLVKDATNKLVNFVPVFVVARPDKNNKKDVY